MIITHPDQTHQDLAVPLRVSLITAGDEFDRRVYETEGVGPAGGLFGIVCGGEMADLPWSVHCGCQGRAETQRGRRAEERERARKNTSSSVSLDVR